jgi:hypothetical protein
MIMVNKSILKILFFLIFINSLGSEEIEDSNDKKFFRLRFGYFNLQPLNPPGRNITASIDFPLNKKISVGLGISGYNYSNSNTAVTVIPENVGILDITHTSWERQYLNSYLYLHYFPSFSKFFFFGLYLGKDRYQANLEQVKVLSNKYANASIYSSRLYSGVSGGLKYDTKFGLFINFELLINYLAGYSPEINIRNAYIQDLSRSDLHYIGIDYVGIENKLLSSSDYGLAKSGIKFVPIITIGWKF